MLELSSVRWLLPDEWKQIAVRMHGQGADRKLPEAPDLVKELVIVSPFVDAATLRVAPRLALVSSKGDIDVVVVEIPDAKRAGDT